MELTTSILIATLLAVFLTGLSKGGLGGAFGILGIPIMSLFMPPMQAAAIMLPILVVMDMAGLWFWRAHLGFRKLGWFLPASALGVAIAWIIAGYLNEHIVRLLVGAIALGFIARQILWHIPTRTKSNTIGAWFWGALSGFTSFVAHAGGPPFQVHFLPLRLDPKTYTGLSVGFFTFINAIKLIPYFALGFFNSGNLSTSLLMLPIAVLAVSIGAFIVKRMDVRVFYPFMYIMITIVGLYLVFDSLRFII